ncbi:MAG: hypothetical protein KGD63_00950 [Candidatus Lokiarchaeota archaeon]|nr:hypothetical protein [Candidatus Lokiarchaeota archaeon]
MSEKCKICGVDLLEKNPKSEKGICPDCRRFRYLFSEILFGFIFIAVLLLWMNLYL